MARQVKLPSVTLASPVSSGLNPGSSISDPFPANIPGKADKLMAWTPPPTKEMEVPDLVQPWPLRSFRE